ncbi:MAG: serine/threonine-protein kinase [Chloroflexota bacterium]|nr:serine/threonine-protein kinase [Chloroflexota bacterium]
MAELTGVMVGNYFLLECLEREGMVETYRARPTMAGGYDVALRLFRPPFPDPTGFREHFETEIEKVWRCRHTHIQPLLEFGAGEELLYCATLFSEETLAQFLESQQDSWQPIERTLRMVAQLCAALQYAHEQGIVHGNIQPSSILIRDDGQVLLTQFGLRRANASGEPLVARLDEGNPAYIAPEQALGALCPASDIYALGVLLYRLLAGVLPYEDPDPGELALKHAGESIPPLRQLRPEIPAALEMVVRVALAKSLEARFPSADAMAEALLAAMRPETSERLADWPRRRIHVQNRRTTHSLTRAVSLLTLTVLLLGLASSFLFVFSLPPQIYDLGRQIIAGGLADLPSLWGKAVKLKPLPTPAGSVVVSTGSTSHNTSHRLKGTVAGAQVTPTPNISQSPVVSLGTPTPGVSPSPGGCPAGTLTIDGSPNLAPLLQQVSSDYQGLCPGVKVSVSADGSRTALTLVQQNQLDVASSDLSALPARGLSDHQVGVLPYVLVASPDIPVNSLSTAQIQAIYQGQITNWSQVGGPNEAINVLLAPAADPLHAVFRTFVLNGGLEQVQGTYLTEAQVGQAAQIVSQATGAITYVPLATMQVQGVKAHVLAINGIIPTIQSLQRDSYPFWSVEHLYTQGTGSAQAQSYLSFFRSAQETSDMLRFGVLPLAMFPLDVLATHLPGPEV